MPGLRRLVRRVTEGPWQRHLVLALATAVLAHLFWAHAWACSREVDGERFFWLDDDQMISMRYARNLARGEGLVWNPGERVEGYTNPFWTVFMALVHLLPGLPISKIALVVEAAGFALTVMTLVGALRLHRRLAGDSPTAQLAGASLALVLVTCPDVVFWPAAGFETGALAAVVTWIAHGLVSQRRSTLGLAVLLSVLPLTRADGLILWGPLAAWVAWERRSRRDLLQLSASLAPAVVHLLLRRAYYGEWLPNTYFLKVQGAAQVEAGMAYVQQFLETYAVPLGLVAFALSLPTLRRRCLPIAVLLAVIAAYAVHVGGDIFRPFRFFAPALPLAFVAASAALATLVERAPALAGPVALVWGALSLPRGGPSVTSIAPAGTNGDPYDQIVVAVLLRRHLPRDAVVHVVAAGIVPYFTDLPAIDGLGKCDRHIARLPAHPGAPIGHGKFDFAYSIGTRHPDVVVAYRPLDVAASYGRRDIELPSEDYIGAMLSSPAFVNGFLPFPVAEPITRRTTALFLRHGVPPWASPVTAP